MIKKTEDEEHEQLIKHTHKQSKSKKKEVLTPREDFVRNKLKEHLRI